MTTWPLAIVLAVIAAIYASVGHAGATGYIAVMSLWGLPPEFIRPTALMLNVVVAAIGTVQFVRAGHFDWKLFASLAVASVPAAALGGWLALPTFAFEAALGMMLGYSSFRLVRDTFAEPDSALDDEPVVWEPTRPWRRHAAFAGLGAIVGFLSGLTGVGGGVFLTPVLLAAGVARLRTVAAVSAAFILVNSLAGLLGGAMAGRAIPTPGMELVGAVAVGGAIGSSLGAFAIPLRGLRLLMAVVLGIASLKLLF